MLFHAIHKHTHATCPAHNPEKRAHFAKVLASASDIGVNIIGSYADAPGHAVYLVLEADSALQIAEFFETPRRLGALGHTADEKGHELFRSQVEETENLREDARNLMLFEQAREWLMGGEGGSP